MNVNCKKPVLGSQQSLLGGLGEPYPTSLHDLNSVLWLKCYSIFSTKSVLKSQEVNLEKKSSGNFYIYQNRSCRKNVKNDFKIVQNGLPRPRKPRGDIPNILISRCHQNLSNYVYRIEIGTVEKKMFRIDFLYKNLASFGPIYNTPLEGHI